MKPLGAVLAGGQSRRFGSDKALALLDQTPLLDWARATLAPWTEAVVICGRPGGLADRPGPGLGPLGGLAAALHHGAGQGFATLLSLPCDVPVLPDAALARLIGTGSPAYLETCPVIGLWPCALAPVLDQHLLGADRSMRGWAARIGAIPVRIEGAIANINTPEDLARLSASRHQPAPGALSGLEREEIIMTDQDDGKDGKPLDDGKTIDVRKLRDEDAGDQASDGKSPLEDAGSPGGTSGTGGTAHDQDG